MLKKVYFILEKQFINLTLKKGKCNYLLSLVFKMRSTCKKSLTLPLTFLENLSKFSMKIKLIFLT